MTPNLPTDHEAPGWGGDFLDWLQLFRWPQQVRSGFYLSSGGASGSGGLTQNRLWLAPIVVPSTITVIEANVNVVTAAASNVLRAGIYTDDGNGAPASLVLEFGATFDASTTGTKTQAISQVLTAGVYWVGGSNQGAATASYTSVAQIPAYLFVTSGAATNPTPRAYFQDSVSGALPSTFTFSLANTASICPLVTLKVQ